MTQLGADPLAEARPGSYWHDRHGVGPTTEPLVGDTAADVVVGGGFTGLWSAITVKRRHPEQDVVPSRRARRPWGDGSQRLHLRASPTASATARAVARQIEELLELGRANLRGLAADLDEQGISADLRLTGKTVVATTPHEAASLVPLAS